LFFPIFKGGNAFVLRLKVGFYGFGDLNFIVFLSSPLSGNTLENIPDRTKEEVKEINWPILNSEKGIMAELLGGLTTVVILLFK
jgi:hypothetical protein